MRESRSTKSRPHVEPDGLGRRWRHGDYETPEYLARENVVARCCKTSHPMYSYYGGRGIAVCDRWRDYVNFIADMGRRPSSKHTLDRVDNSKGYEPSNCRWTTRREQMRNTRRTRLFTYDGQTLCMKDWAETVGMPYSTLRARLKYGWSFVDAITRPVR